jgi:hypothetical protein
MASTYGNVSVTSTATLILAANNERKGSLIVNNDATVSMYIGMDANVTTSNGLPIGARSTFNNSGQNALWKGAIYGIVASGTVDTRYWEYIT